MAKEATSELSKWSVWPVSSNELECELSACLVPIKALDFELCPISCNESDFEPSVCPVSINVPECKWSACHGGPQLRPLWRSSVLLKLSSAPLWWSSAPSFLPWWSSASSALLWGSSVRLWWSSALPLLSKHPAPPWLFALPWLPAPLRHPALPWLSGHIGSLPHLGSLLRPGSLLRRLYPGSLLQALSWLPAPLAPSPVASVPHGPGHPSLPPLLHLPPRLLSVPIKECLEAICRDHPLECSLAPPEGTPSLTFTIQTGPHFP